MTHDILLPEVSYDPKQKGPAPSRTFRIYGDGSVRLRLSPNHSRYSNHARPEENNRRRFRSKKFNLQVAPRLVRILIEARQEHRAIKRISSRKKRRCSHHAEISHAACCQHEASSRSRRERNPIRSPEGNSVKFRRLVYQNSIDILQLESIDIAILQKNASEACENSVRCG
jgi:hypothetical protein